LHIFVELDNRQIMDFIHIGFIDIVDIFVTAALMFYLYKMAKGTNAPSIITGIIIIYILWVLTGALNMELLSSILGKVISVGVIALIVVFQPEIRQFLQTIGLKQRNSRGHSFWKRLFGLGHSEETMDVRPVIKAVLDMSGCKTGALVVIQQETDLGFIAETGIPVDAHTSASLLENIFFKNAPLHDGAVIIHRNRVVAAKCVLPSTRTPVPKAYGMRHRAAIGMSEVSDAVVVVVSEETGGISIALEGIIERNIARDAFSEKLISAVRKSGK
jgi:uncharacterized protein (TIGR00159 family)